MGLPIGQAGIDEITASIPGCAQPQLGIPALALAIAIPPEAHGLGAQIVGQWPQEGLGIAGTGDQLGQALKGLGLTAAARVDQLEFLGAQHEIPLRPAIAQRGAALQVARAGAGEGRTQILEIPDVAH